MHTLISEEFARARMSELRANAESGRHARAAAVAREALAAERQRAGTPHHKAGVIEPWERWFSVLVPAAFLGLALVAGSWTGLVLLAGVLVAGVAAGFWFGADSRDPNQRPAFAAPERRRADTRDTGTICS